LPVAKQYHSKQFRVYLQTNRELLLELRRGYYQRTKVVRITGVKADQQRLRDRLYEILGGKKCVVKDCKSNSQLQFDHIMGLGNEEKRERFKGDTRTMYRYYVNHPEEAIKKLQVMCAHHNIVKRIELGEQ
jgi:hypothetical protein